VSADPQPSERKELAETTLDVTGETPSAPRPRRRASDHVRAKPEGLFGHLRLRHKLGIILTVAALLPVLGASTVAIRLVLAGLKSGARAQAERTMRVALNLVLTHVKDVFENTIRLSETAGLSDLLVLDPQSTDELLARKEDQLMPGLVEIADADGKVVGRRFVGGRGSRALQLANNAEPIRNALGYERRVTIERPGDAHLLVIRAVAPVVDEAYQLRGAVVVTVPLDAEFADRLKAQLSADVIVYQADKPTASSFVADDGRRENGFTAPTDVAESVLLGRPGQDGRWLRNPRAPRDVFASGMPVVIDEAQAHGRMYSVAYAPLQDLESHRLGMIAVAVDEDALVQAKAQAWRSLALGGASAVVFALALAALLSRGLTRPLGHLHAAAIAVARGDLDHPIVQETGDEIGDLAVAFAQMTRAVKDNRDRLADRMREIVTLHDIGRAVSSVLALDEVLRKIVDEVAAVMSSRRSCLLLTREDGNLEVGAGVGLIESPSSDGASGGAVSPLQGIVELAEAIAWRGGPVRVEDVDREAELKASAEKAAVRGSLLAVPLEQKDRVLGMLLVTRRNKPFSDADLRLLATFANQASTAISNARLYDEVQKASTQLEQKVQERTIELLIANKELEVALSDLRQAQAALVHSERMAGLGQLVAGVAHEVNSPAAAIQGAVDNLADNVERLARRARELGEVRMAPNDRTRFFALVEQLAPRLQGARVEAPALVRRQAKELASKLSQLGLSDVEQACRTLVEIGAGEAAYQIAQLAERSSKEGLEDAAVPKAAFLALVGYLEQYAYLFRNTHAIRTAIRRITRIVGALKGYSHLDQAKVTPADIHEGIENTLVILHSELKYGITVTRKYAELPLVPIYVDELNQVWTNLIHNAVQALGGRGEIVIETRVEGPHVAIAVEDNGPGIPSDVMPRIFEPFFTTKAKGEGTGLGLGIVKQIVDKHGGTIEVTSQPGRTRFTILVPIAGPGAAAKARE
jgi:signal transduction histidine kinase